jgi:hypothetical protein
MKMKITDGADPNYLATVVKCPELKPHPNADRLQLLTIFGNDVIVAKDMYTPGEKLVYFPVESCISQKFLSWANLLDKPELNADGKTKGFFGCKNGRVKAISLRSIPSQGFLYKASKLSEYYEIDENTFNIGDSFDTIGDDTLVKKYIKGDVRGSGEQNVKKSRIPKWVEKTIGILPRPIRRKAYMGVNLWYNRNNEGIKNRIMDDFSQHYKTEMLGKNIFLVNPEDFITISSKWHGTSFYAGRVKCKKPFSPFRNIINIFGGNIPDTEYTFCYSSRSILKNRRDGKFTDDVWGIIASEIREEIPENIKIYGEIVGFTPSGKTIQKNYDYSVNNGECELRVYRITENIEGGVRELEWYEIEEFCYEHGLKTVPVYYNGLASELFNIPIDLDWRDKFLTKLKETYLDKPCEFCKNDVVNEGIVLRIETTDKKTALKFKSPLFNIRESIEKDNNENNLEDES